MSKIETIDNSFSGEPGEKDLSLRNIVKSALSPKVLLAIREIRYGRTDFPYRAEIELGGISANFSIDNPIAKHRLEQFGGERYFARDFLAAIDRNSVVLDIGASLGLYTVLAARKAEKVIAVEPDPGVMQALEKNVKDNEVGNVVLVKKAAGYSNDRVILFTGGVESRSPSVNVNVNKHTSRIEVEGTRADNLIQQLLENKIIPKEPDVIKIDVEGYEKEVLMGMGDLLKKDSAPKHIFIELHPIFLSQFGTTINEILEIIDITKYKKVSRRRRSDELLFHFVLKQ